MHFQYLLNILAPEIILIFMHQALYIALLAKGIVYPMHMHMPLKYAVNAANGDVLKLQFFYCTPFYVHLI